MLSIWRYSHLILAISSALFIAVASLTGIILALEPISNSFKVGKISNLESITVAETVQNLQHNYKEIIGIYIDENSFVKVDVITKDNKSETFLINPETGKKIAEIEKRHPVFEFTTNLHRSLFLKSTGRVVVAVFTFLFLLLAIAGFGLLLQRQGGFKKLFAKTIKEDTAQFYHVLLSKYTLIPIVIIAITGVYLSLEKFDIIPSSKKETLFFESKSNQQIKSVAAFPIFKTTSLEDLVQLDFPFSSDKDEYFYLKLKDKELSVQQYTGEIVSEKKLGVTSFLNSYSLWLHTGRGTFFWAFVLLFTCIAICYFIYSGFVIFLKRKRQTAVLQNTYTKDNAEFILLVGSETGSTKRFANAFFKGLLNANKKVFIDSLNNYTTYQKAKHIVVFTATYGDGDAPANANQFLKKFTSIRPTESIQFSVVGFGSSNYPEFCKYAILVNATLQIHEKFIPVLPLHTIDNQSKTAFKNWVKEWSTFYKIDLTITDDLLEEQSKQQLFKVLAKSEINEDDTFTIQLKPKKKVAFSSGDLLAILPKDENVSRLYSIAKVRHTILLSVKKHEHGVCSNWVSQLKIGDTFKATIQKNASFHFPKDAKEVLLIANGTGIAPFLGMIQSNPKTVIHLFLGVRNCTSLSIYKPYLQFENLTTLEISFSRAPKSTQYVQDSIVKQSTLVKQLLQNEGKIMVCGSLAMQKGVENELEKVLQFSPNRLKKNKQLKIDCY
jgi:sulfite reductase (NADPH) flavoprotein alpha-component